MKLLSGINLLTGTVLLITVSFLTRWDLLKNFLYFPITLLLIAPFIFIHLKNIKINFVGFGLYFIISIFMAVILLIISYVACFLVCKIELNYLTGALFYLISPILVYFSKFNLSLIIFSCLSIFFILLISINFFEDFIF
jgi:hypothetical protein